MSILTLIRPKKLSTADQKRVISEQIDEINTLIAQTDDEYIISEILKIMKMAKETLLRKIDETENWFDRFM